MTNEEYKVNFFKPLSDHARANKKLIVVLATIWFVAVFGFHALLIVLSEPVPEKAYDDFQSVWPAISENQNPTLNQERVYARSLLSVLGKNIAVLDEHKVVLKDALSASVYSLLADSVKSVMMQDISDEKVQISAQAVGLKNEGFDKLMTALLPTSLVKVNSSTISPEIKNQLPAIMELYLIHNRSVLTDFTFLGFPFHYWYSSQFLLILFVVLCLIYAVLIEKTNKEYNFVEEE